MNDQVIQSPAASSEGSQRVTIPSDTSLSVKDAAGLLGSLEDIDKKRGQKSEQAAPPHGEDGAAPQESAEQADTDASEEAPPGETMEDNTEDDLPAIDPPRSWNKQAKEAFKALPRAQQEELAENDRARDKELRRGLDEVATRAKQIASAQQAAEQARQRYEAALPTLMQAIQSQTAQDFPDIKSWDDVQKMSNEDPVRYLQWDASRKRADAIQTEMRNTQARQTQETQQRFNQYRQTELQAFLEKAPEFADPEKAPKLRAEAQNYLTEELGVSGDELKALIGGQSGISIHDHRVQLLIRDAMSYRRAQKAVKTPARPVVPPVQRPGNASTKAEARGTELQTLTKTLDRTHSVKDAVALLKAQRRA